jgi:hypothetical protein
MASRWQASCWKTGSGEAWQTFSDLLTARGVSAQVIRQLVRLLRRTSTPPHAGRPSVRLIFSDDSLRKPYYFVYEADQVEHVVFGLDPLSVHEGRRPIRTQERAVDLTVTGALYNDITAAGADPMLAMQLADILAWTVDFYRIQKGDRFTVVYKERTVDGERYGEPEIVAVRYQSGEVIQDGYRFSTDSLHHEYFDDEGNSLRKAFLQAPLKYSRISSGFSNRRFHPVQKTFQGAQGTGLRRAVWDADPHRGRWGGGEDRLDGGNGNFVKVRHNGTYTTQYLHMRKILVREGQRVVQGDVIGGGGSTGSRPVRTSASASGRTASRSTTGGRNCRAPSPLRPAIGLASRPLRAELKRKLDGAQGASAVLPPAPQPAEF